MKNLFRLGFADFAKGFCISVGGVFLAGLLVFLQATPPRFPNAHELVILALASLGSGVAYIIKNFFTNSQNQFGKKEPDKS